jgi:Na+-transporting NADH:ubiquinone oxidoreductase subunit NqrB
MTRFFAVAAGVGLVIAALALGLPDLATLPRADIVAATAVYAAFLLGGMLLILRAVAPVGSHSDFAGRRSETAR